MPEFYDWTGADQSRPAPIVGWIAIGISLFDLTAIGILGWLHFTHRWPSDDRKNDWQFSTKHLFLVMVGTALLLILGKWISLYVIFSVLLGIVWLSLVVFAIRFPSKRLLLVTLFLCQTAPYLWVMRKGSAFTAIGGVVWMGTTLPAFFPSMLISALMQQHFQSMQWVAIFFTIVEVVVGAWMISLGMKRAISYYLVVATLSIFGSFVLHALMRA